MHVLNERMPRSELAQVLFGGAAHGSLNVRTRAPQLASGSMAL